MLEVICRGKPSLVEPTVFRMAMRLGLATAGVTGWPAGDHYRILRISRPTPAETPDRPLAVVELQEIPGDRTALFFGAVGEPHQDVQVFAQALINELIRFEFVAKPEEPKGPIGFRIEDADQLEGARLLETFDAINSAGFPPVAVPAAPSGTDPAAPVTPAAPPTTSPPPAETPTS